MISTFFLEGYPLLQELARVASVEGDYKQVAGMYNEDGFFQDKGNIFQENLCSLLTCERSLFAQRIQK